MTDLTPVLQAVVALASALITLFILPWLRRHTSAREREELLRWTDIAVEAAQQLHHQRQSSDRKAYVQAFLERKGYDIDDMAVDAAIESAVLRLHREMAK